MFESIKTLKVTVLVLFAYSIVVTGTFITQKNYTSSSYLEEINQLNAQINSLKIELENKDNDNKDLIAIREMMEKERAEKEEAMMRDREASSKMGGFFEGENLFNVNVFDALEGKSEQK